MEPKDVERVKQIVRDELGPALEIKAREIEDRMSARVTTFEQHIETRVEQRHSESRVRLQMLYDQAVEAAQKAALAAGDAAKAVAGTDYIVDRLNKQDERGEKTQSLVLELLVKVNKQTGHIEGVAEAEAEQDAKAGKRMGILKWVGGVLVSGGVGKWLAAHFHWFGVSK